MTKGGSFKRAVRREARATGLSYTQALARRERERNTVDGRVGAWQRWRRLDGLADHGGRGPRLAAFAGLLQAAVGHARADDVVDAVVDGYAPHVRPAAEELDRLAGAMRLQPAYYAAWGYWRAVASGRTPVVARLTDRGAER